MNLAVDDSVPIRGSFRQCVSVAVMLFMALFFFSVEAISGNGVVLTSEERAWLKKNDGRIRFAPSPSYAPVCFLSADGDFRGITMDYVRLIESHLGFQFEVVSLNSWAEIMQKADAGEIDVVGNIQRTKERERNLFFTESYITIPNVIVSQSGFDVALSLETMRNMRLAIVKGYATYRYVEENFPEIVLVPVGDSSEALQMVSLGRVDATVIDLAVASRLITQQGITNLKVAGNVPEFVWHLSFASRKDEPLLHSILEKGLRSVSLSEAQDIQIRWISLGSNAPMWKNWRFYAAIASIFVFLSLVVLTWTVSLRRSIARQTKELRFNMAHMRTLVEAIPELVWLKDVNGVYLFCNKRFERFFGAVESEIVGKTDYDFVDKKLADDFLENDRIAMNASKPVMNEETVTYKDDGHVEDLETIKSPMFDDNGNLIGVLGVARDMTERKRTADELRESQLRFKALHNASFGGIAIHDKGVILDCNQGLTEISGYAMEELVGMDGLLLIAEQSREMVMKNIVSGYEAPYEAFGVRKNGEEYPLRLEARNVPYKGKSVRAVEFRDITNRRRIEEELRDRELRYRVIFENSPLGMIRFSSDGVILDCNDLFVDLMGSSKEELIGFDSCRRSGPEMTLALKKALAGEVSSFEDYYTSVTGNKQTFLHVEFNPVNAGQSPTEVIATLEDVSARKQAQDELRAAKEEAEKSKELAEAASRSKTEFLTNMSHEIRTPLNGILGMLQLIQATGLDKTQVEYVLAAMQSSKRLTTLLTDILDLSRVEAGKLSVQSISFDLPETLEQVCELFRLTSEQAGVKLVCEADPLLPKVVKGDAIRLQQVLTNLAGNAFKFTTQGSITINAHVVNHEEADLCRVLFTVADTGTGIPDDELGTLFDSFTQVSQGYNRKHQGAGLGLAICKRLVSLMGGSMAIESEEGVGTIFYVLIPFSIDTSIQQASLPLEKPETLTVAGLNILLAEDERVNGLVTQRFLENSGHIVRTVVNGQQVIEALQEDEYDTVLMDIQMPVMDGLEATRIIRSGNAGEKCKNISIVAVTAFAMVGDKEKFLDAGMDDYVVKPIELKALQSVLSRLHGRKIQA